MQKFLERLYEYAPYTFFCKWHFQAFLQLMDELLKYYLTLDPKMLLCTFQNLYHLENLRNSCSNPKWLEQNGHLNLCTNNNFDEKLQNKNLDSPIHCYTLTSTMLCLHLNLIRLQRSYCSTYQSCVLNHTNHNSIIINIHWRTKLYLR